MNNSKFRFKIGSYVVLTKDLKNSFYEHKQGDLCRVITFFDKASLYLVKNLNNSRNMLVNEYSIELEDSKNKTSKYLYDES